MYVSVGIRVYVCKRSVFVCVCVFVMSMYILCMYLIFANYHPGTFIFNNHKLSACI